MGEINLVREPFQGDSITHLDVIVINVCDLNRPERAPGYVITPFPQFPTGHYGL